MRQTTAVQFNGSSVLQPAPRMVGEGMVGKGIGGKGVPKSDGVSVNQVGVSPMIRELSCASFRLTQSTTCRWDEVTSLGPSWPSDGFTESEYSRRGTG